MDFNSQVQDFIVTALSLESNAIISSDFDSGNRLANIKLYSSPAISGSDILAFEQLVEKYRSLQPILDQIEPNLSDENLKSTQVTLEPNTNYKLVKIDVQQVKLAKELKARIDEIFSLNSRGENELAKLKYDDYFTFVEKNRTDLMGELNGFSFQNPVMTYGADRSTLLDDQIAARPDSGLVIFIALEIIIG